jgi:hypothetical protein
MLPAAQWRLRSEQMCKKNDEMLSGSAGGTAWKMHVGVTLLFGCFSHLRTPGASASTRRNRNGVACGRLATAGDAAQHARDVEARAFDECHAWACREGVAFAGVEVAQVEVGWRGCCANRDVAAGDLLLSVPARLLLTCTSARRDARLAAAARTLRPDALLAVHLLHEVSKGAASRWHAYLRTLPRKFTDGGGFTAEEAAALQAPYAVAAIALARHERRCDWDAARSVLADLALLPKLCTWAAWSWAASAVATRTVFFPEDPPGAGAAAVQAGCVLCVCEC